MGSDHVSDLDYDDSFFFSLAFLLLKSLLSSTVKVKAMMMTLFKKSIAQNTTQFPFARKLFLTKVITFRFSSTPNLSSSSTLPASMPIDL